MALTLPSTFPDAAWTDLKDRVAPKIPNPSLEINNFMGGWQAVRFRFRAATENAGSCIASMRISGPKSEDQQYQEEQALAELYSSGLSAIESFCFCVYFAGAASPAKSTFLLTSNPRSIKLKTTSEHFKIAFPAEQITKELDALESDSDFIEWADIRNVVAHRVTPGRIISFGAISAPAWNLPPPLNKIPLDDATVQNKLDWLTDRISRLILAAQASTL